MGAQPDAPVVDTAETVHISSLALLKMLKHGPSPVVCCVCVWVSLAVQFVQHFTILYTTERAYTNAIRASPHITSNANARALCTFPTLFFFL